MKMLLPISLLCGLSLLSAGLPRGGGLQRQAVAQEQETADRITVDLAGGRSFTAEVDQRTDASELWLRFRRDGTTVLRPVRWDRVARARIGREEVSGEQFREIVDAVRRAMPAAEPSGRAEDDFTLTDNELRGRRPAGRSASITPVAPSIRSLAIEANVANWDADVEVDGLVVRVVPMDARGAVVSTRGTIEIDLTAQRSGMGGGAWRAVRAGRWAKQVRHDDFDVSGVVFRLPFQGHHPEFDLDLGAYGAVHARLSVPGQGTFEATSSTTRIRPASLMRDRLQQTTGRRFYPEERTSRR